MTEIIRWTVRKGDTGLVFLGFEFDLEGFMSLAPVFSAMQEKDTGIGVKEGRDY